MPSEYTPSPAAKDPLFGNKASDLMRAAADARPATDPAGWQPPAPETLQGMLPGYEVREFLARGGMGAVYRGEQTSLGRQVAIKILPPQLRDADPHYAERFKQEARAMAQLNHPGIVSVYDFGEMPDGTLYFIMEFIDGTDVGQMVAKQSRLGSAHAMAITAHVCDALQYAHEHGVVHRDIKPANIMVGYDGRVKVADFGLAKSVHQQNTSLTVSGHVMGTPHFVAPEALTLGMSIDHRADIYAVGVMLYQMLTGKLPQGLFEMPSMQVPGLDPRYDAIVAGAMREDREQRYQNIIEMRRALDAILTQPVLKSEVAQQTVPAATIPKSAQRPRPAGQPYRPPQHNVLPPAPKRKSSAGWLAATIVGIALTGGFLWMQRDGQPVSAPVTSDTKLQIKADTASAPVKTSPVPVQSPASTISPSHATKEKPFINSLGMKFVPVPGTSVLMCIHETRVKDYAVFAKETTNINSEWQSPADIKKPLPTGPEHGVTMITWSEANAFCQWLSKKEGRTYRLPTDREWCVAAGITDANGKTVQRTFPEESAGHAGWPPPPVMSRKANEFGIHDLGGTLGEWCDDSLPSDPSTHIIRTIKVDAPEFKQAGDGDGPSTRRPYTTFRCVLESVGSERPGGSATAAIQTNKPLAPQSSTGQPIEVKLDFMNAEKFFDVGGYQPVGAPLRSSAPKSIRKAPLGLISPLYGEIFMGPPASERTHAVIVDNSKASGSRLYVDSNANGDLTDDPPAKWQPGQQSNVATGAKWSVFQGEFMLELKMADGSHPARFEAYRNLNSQGQDSLWFHPQYGRVGRVTIAGKRVNALLYDDEAKGDFSHPSCTFRLDLNGDLAYRSEQSEVFPVSKPFTLDGTAYELSGLTPDGATFLIARSGAPAAQSSTASKISPAKNGAVSPATTPAQVGSPPLSSQEYRNFTDTKGRTIRATLVSIRGDDVTLKRDDGHEFTVKAATLSSSDIEYLKTRGLVMSQAPATAQVPTTAPSSSPSRNLAIPEESKSSTLQQTTVFGLSRTDASGILASSRLKSNPKSVLETVQGMVAGKRATLVANLSVSAKSGTRSRVEGSYGCESEITMNADGGLKAMFAITSIRSPGSAKLSVLDVAAKRGETHFLGSFDEDDADTKMPVRLVFVTFH